MGRVLPRENSGVDAVPCRMLTHSTGSLMRGSEGFDLL